MAANGWEYIEKSEDDATTIEAFEECEVSAVSGRDCWMLSEESMTK
jgi:hypothetical protein